MDGDAQFVDTNILVFLTNSASPWHADALRAIANARSTGTRLVISTQIVREFLSVGSREVGGAPGLPRALVVHNARALCQSFELVAESKDVLEELLKLVDTVSVAGKQIQDANIVATMRVHGIKRLLTHNVQDFARFATLIDIEPLVRTA